MSCASPIPFETLVDLWSRDVADPEAVEAHLFACDDCAATAEQLDRLLGTMLTMVPPVLTRGLRDRLEARGLRIKDLTFDPGHGEAFFAADLDLLVFALRSELANATRVDLEVLDSGNGEVSFAFPHVPFDPARGEVLVACQQHYRDMPSVGDPEFRLYAVDSAGTRRQVGSYRIKHVWPPL